MKEAADISLAITIFSYAITTILLIGTLYWWDSIPDRVKDILEIVGDISAAVTFILIIITGGLLACSAIAKTVM